LAEALSVSPRPFLVAVMVAASAAFATPFGYQTNVLVYQMGGYRYLDFVRVGVPLNLITWVVGVIAIQFWFPF
jgi:di/tricarboxylate transporter